MEPRISSRYRHSLLSRIFGKFCMQRAASLLLCLCCALTCLHVGSRSSSSELSHAVRCWGREEPWLLGRGRKACPRQNLLVIYSLNVVKQFIVLISVSLGCEKENEMRSFFSVLSQALSCEITARGHKHAGSAGAVAGAEAAPLLA